ncbi:hypothetical protein H9P43_002785 [Blastocladiella emersonii ATCC 22665]|nr:hypothetical protein H9P43_002785 [Blastocladiella emersonii ATCC 22665]
MTNPRSTRASAPIGTASGSAAHASSSSSSRDPHATSSSATDSGPTSPPRTDGSATPGSSANSGGSETSRRWTSQPMSPPHVPPPPAHSSSTAAGSASRRPSHLTGSTPTWSVVDSSSASGSGDPLGATAAIVIDETASQGSPTSTPGSRSPLSNRSFNMSFASNPDGSMLFSGPVSPSPYACITDTFDDPTALDYNRPGAGPPAAPPPSSTVSPSLLPPNPFALSPGLGLNSGGGSHLSIVSTTSTIASMTIPIITADDRAGVLGSSSISFLPSKQPSTSSISGSTQNNDHAGNDDPAAFRSGSLQRHPLGAYLGGGGGAVSTPVSAQHSPSGSAAGVASPPGANSGGSGGGGGGGLFVASDTMVRSHSTGAVPNTLNGGVGSSTGTNGGLRSPAVHNRPSSFSGMIPGLAPAVTTVGQPLVDQHRRRNTAASTGSAGDSDSIDRAIGGSSTGGYANYNNGHGSVPRPTSSTTGASMSPVASRQSLRYGGGQQAGSPPYQSGTILRSGLASPPYTTGTSPRQSSPLSHASIPDAGSDSLSQPHLHSRSSGAVTSGGTGHGGGDGSPSMRGASSRNSASTHVPDLPPSPYLLVRLWRRIEAFYMHQIRDPNTAFWTVWSRVILSIEVYNVFSVPFSIAWICHFTMTPAYMYIGYILDLILLLDVWLSFNRRFEDEFGVLIKDPKEIKNHYLKRMHGYWTVAGSVPIDLLCLVLPLLRSRPLRCERMYFPGTDTYAFFYDRTVIPDYLYAWALLRLTRWLRLPHLLGVFSDWNVAWLGNVTYMRLIKNFIVFLTAGHIDACLFFVLNTWEPVGTAWIDTIGVRNNTNEVVFITHLSALQSIVYVFRDINTNAERLYTTMEIILGSVIYGSIFGVLSNFIRALDTRAALDKAAEKYRFKMTYLRDFLRAREFPVGLQQKILQHEEFLWMKGQGMDEDKLFENLPKSLRQDVCNHLYMDLVEQVPLFRGTDAMFKASLTRAMKTIVVPAEFFICRQGDDGQEMYFIRSGEVEVLTGDLSRVIVSLGQNAYFGEIALFEDTRRNASVRTKTTVELCVLNKDSFIEILVNYPAVAEIFHKAIAERKAMDARKQAEAEAKERAAAEAAAAAAAAAERRRQQAQRRKERARLNAANQSSSFNSGGGGRFGTIGRRGPGGGSGSNGGTGSSNGNGSGGPPSGLGRRGSELLTNLGMFSSRSVMPHARSGMAAPPSATSSSVMSGSDIHEEEDDESVLDGDPGQRRTGAMDIINLGWSNLSRGAGKSISNLRGSALNIAEGVRKSLGSRGKLDD